MGMMMTIFYNTGVDSKTVFNINSGRLGSFLRMCEKVLDIYRWVQVEGSLKNLEVFLYLRFLIKYS